VICIRNAESVETCVGPRAPVARIAALTAATRAPRSSPRYADASGVL